MDAAATAVDDKSNRPLKKYKPNTTVGAQNQAVEALFAKQPDLSRAFNIVPRGPKTAADLAPPPEIVTNVQGSSAGAGSGEFHVYKAARRREYERLRLMDEEAKREEDELAYNTKIGALKARDEARSNKNRKKREKLKAARSKGSAEITNDKASLVDDKLLASTPKLTVTPLRAHHAEGAALQICKEPHVQEEQGITIEE